MKIWRLIRWIEHRQEWVPIGWRYYKSHDDARSAKRQRIKDPSRAEWIVKIQSGEIEWRDE